jgi:hypothetical protein
LAQADVEGILKVGIVLWSLFKLFKWESCI